MDLGDSRLEDEGAAAVADTLKENGAPLCLNLSGNQLTDGLAEHISPALMTSELCDDQMTEVPAAPVQVLSHDSERVSRSGALQKIILLKAPLQSTHCKTLSRQFDNVCMNLTVYIETERDDGSYCTRAPPGS